jgi:hypothetical protein
MSPFAGLGKPGCIFVQVATFLKTGNRSFQQYGGKLLLELHLNRFFHCLLQSQLFLPIFLFITRKDLFIE